MVVMVTITLLHRSKCLLQFFSGGPLGVGSNVCFCGALLLQDCRQISQCSSSACQARWQQKIVKKKLFIWAGNLKKCIRKKSLFLFLLFHCKGSFQACLCCRCWWWCSCWPTPSPWWWWSWCPPSTPTPSCWSCSNTLLAPPTTS